MRRPWTLLVLLMLLPAPLALATASAGSGDAPGAPGAADAPAALAVPQAEHAPIALHGDAALMRLAEREGWTGSGTAADPYRMPAYNVSLFGAARGTTGILLVDTQKHLVVADTTVWSPITSYDGVRLVNVRNVTLERVVADHVARGIVVERSPGTIVRDAVVRHAQSAILVHDSTGVRLEGNEVHIAEKGYHLAKARGNVFRDNAAAVAAGQYGFYFQDEVSFVNDIDTSNRVNNVSMQWHVGLKGTGHSPIRMPGIEVHSAGLNNVAQVLFYGCWWLVVEDLAVSHGQNGVVVIDGERVRLVRPSAEKNVHAGIELRDGFDNHVESAVVRTNGHDGLRLVREDVDRVTDLHASANGRAGLRIDGGGGHTVSGARLEHNGGQGLAVSSSLRNAVVDGQATSNGGAGFAANLGTDERFERLTASENHGPGFAVSRNHGKLTMRDLEAHENGGDGIEASRVAHAFLERIDARANGRAGVALEAASMSFLNDSALVGNRGEGVRVAAGTTLSTLQHLTVRDNRDTGISLRGAGLANRLVDLAVTNHTAGVRLSGSPGTLFERVSVTTATGAQTGFAFEDERSYDVHLPPTNTVNGTGVQWFNGVTGLIGAPVSLENLTVTHPRVTNVAQIMLYRASHVVVPGAVAAHGARGILVHSSSNVTIEKALVGGNDIGLEMAGTLHSRAVGVDAAGARVGVLLSGRTSDSHVMGVSAQHAQVAVQLDGGSRGNVVEQTNATNVTRASVVDASIRDGRVRADNFVVDAGLDKRALPYEPVIFDGALVSVPRDHEPIVLHHWAFGDGTTFEAEGLEPPRVEHTYAVEGNFSVEYTVRTASGREFSDTLRILVWEAPQEPRELKANGTGGVVNVSWQPPANARWPVVYELLRSPADARGPWAVVATLDNETAFSDEDVAMDATYRYAVRALRAPLASGIGDPASARVVPAPAVLPTAGGTAEATERPLESTATTPVAPAAADDGEELPWRLIALGAAGLVAVVLVFGGQFVQARP